MHLLDSAYTFNLWQRFFEKQKIQHFLDHNDLSKPCSVLDLGCGPGSNAQYFLNHHYHGVDINESYIRFAETKYDNYSNLRFSTLDVTNLDTLIDEPYKMILLNSLLHHIDDSGVHKVLDLVANILTKEGYVNIIDLVMPDTPGLSKCLARYDRGDWPRKTEVWKNIFASHFTESVFETYTMKYFGLDFWKLVYFKGTSK